MYELTCPFCRQAIRSPYVRTDAVATCPRCHERYQIKPEYVRRSITPTSEQATAGLDSLSHSSMESLLSGESGSGTTAANVAGSAINTSADALNVRRSGVGVPSKTPSGIAASPVIVSSGPASAAASATGSGIRSARPVATPNAPTATAADASRPSASLLSPFTNKPLQARWIYFLPMAMLILVACFLGWMWLRHSSDESRQAPDFTTAPSVVFPVDLDPRIPLLVSERLIKASWRIMEEQEQWTAGAQNLVRTTDEKWTFIDSQRIYYNTQISSASALPLINARIQFCLLDSREKGLAFAEYPTVLLFGDLSQTLNLQVPLDLYQKHARIDWKVVIDPQQQPWTKMESLQSQPVGKRQSTLLRMVLRNQTQMPVKDILVLIVALDKEGQTLARWRAKSVRAMSPGQALDVAVPTPLESGLDPAEWRVNAAGLVDMDNNNEKKRAATNPALP